MKIQATVRLLADPISNGERTRFMLELQKRVRILRDVENRGTYLEAPMTLSLEQLKRQLNKLGWLRFSRSFVGYEVTRDDWTWPIEIVKSDGSLIIRLGKSDGAETAKSKLTEAAKAILPGGFGVYEDHAHFMKSGIDRETIQKILKDVQKKALKYGFRDIKDEYRFGPLVLSANVTDSSLELFIDFDQQRGL